MVVGNFFLIAGIDPQAALRWYLEMTVDAYDWVMVPNALGIILYADGGFVATKPYAAGGGYIHKMSNYCEGCRYSPLKKDRAGRLSLQRALLGFPRPPRGPAARQPASQPDDPDVGGPFSRGAANYAVISGEISGEFVKGLELRPYS